MSEFMRALTRFYGGLVFRIRDLLYAILVWTLVSLRKFLRLCVVSLAPLGLVGAIWLHWPNYTDRCVGLAPKEAQDLLRTNASGWYNQEGADTVVIFVHGFMSNNVTAWCYLDQDNPREDTFFPELIRNDMRLGEDAVDIFIAGYFTSLTSTEFDVRATARALYSDLRRQDSRLLRNNVFDYDKIIFVAHSAGGIVVRQMLVEHVDWLSGKHIGLVLLASPSAGSLYAYQFTQAIDILETHLPHNSVQEAIL